MAESESTNVSTAYPPSLEVTASRQFTSWLAEVDASLAFTTYQAGKILTVGTKEDDSISIFERSIDRCMGLAVRGNSLFVSSLFQIWQFENSLAAGQVHNGYDACFLPQMSWVTGDLDTHDMAIDADGGLVFVNTRFGCLARPSETASFVPIWKPDFISDLVPEDRCHLNGLAVDAAGPAYVTSVSRSNTRDGWRDHRREGGCVINVRSGGIVADGLSMPHSPRLYDGKLWLLDSGNGSFGFVDMETGAFEHVAFCPGYARGLAFIDRYAVIGLSRPRNNETFDGLALDAVLKRQNTEALCGLIVVDIDTGETLHWLQLKGIVSELYDIAVLPDMRRPMLVGFKSDEIKHMVKIGQE